ncbi:hypothetical protein HQP04_22510 [Rhodococcus fascians]|nr:hypothetical protein [Rhodococcus fascians]MBY4024804.1 hypothetical protein [Rhodococcus fascians]MBY4275941.1 hypothetical protein [Rhodococcus fascians]MBY4433449.1 hypothetical protein [Rhodococcus fascians]
MGESSAVELSLDDIREVVAFAAACARRALPICEASHSNNLRPCAAIDAALAALHAAGAAFLHPLYNSNQVKHILGSAVHLELTDSKAVAKQIEWTHTQADATFRSVPRLFPQPVAGRTTFGKLLAQLDSELRR